MVATTLLTEAVTDAIIQLALRASDLDDMEVLTAHDAALLHDLRQAVGEVMETVTALLRVMREEARP